MTKTILSLCDFSGTWSNPYRKAGYNVIQLDIQHGQDIRLLKMPTERIHGVLAAPPCTMFCQASAHLWAKRTDEQMREGLSVVDACIRIVFAVRPVWWCLENSAGQLQRWLGAPMFKFHPCQYGDGHRKLTYLWGHFAPPLPPLPAAQGQSNVIERIKGGGIDRMNARSQTPECFARAFFEANP